LKQMGKRIFLIIKGDFDCSFCWCGILIMLTEVPAQVGRTWQLEPVSIVSRLDLI
jgi:hypothetical protein